ncbi:MAG: TonB-dependent receptor [Bacteroidales bacterium]|nr:TonB-dependent receptor [Bacteroidales bacterium]
MKRLKTLMGYIPILLCALWVTSAWAQSSNIQVTGVVYDSKGETIIGANVLEKGTTNGTITGIDGDFHLTVSADATLIVSFIGYKTTEVPVSGQPKIKIVLKEDNEMLEEVVVVGYGVQKKANLTGSVAAVSSKELENIPAANATNLLQGRLPGVTLTSNGGQAGQDTPEIRIRGIGTLSDNNDPMVLIDGVEASVSQIAQIAAADIDNISVLKDAASAAIYGVRAANGVILITTKRGGEMKPTINYSGSYTIQKASILPNYVNSYEWAKMYNESNGREMYTADMLKKLQDGSDPDHFANTDWADALFRTAPMTQHNLSISGGSKDIHYMISAGYLNQEGIMEKTGYERFNFRSNVDAKLGIFKLGMNLSGSKENKKAPACDITSDNGLMRTLTWFTRPTVPVQYSNGEYGQVDGSSISYTVFKNPLQMINQGKKKDTSYRFDGQVFAELDLWKGLKFRSSLAYKFYMNDISTYGAGTAKYDAEGNLLYKDSNNSLSEYHWISQSYTNENILTYNTKINSHELNILLGHSVQEYHEKSTTAYKEGFATDNLYELDAATKNDNAGGRAAEYALQSFFGRISYNYDGRYLFEFNVRHDGSSRMPKSHRYATFPSLSAGWILTNESFMQDVEPLSYLKLRASWGKLGNQEIGNYAYTPTMAASYNYYFGSEKVIGMAENIVANDDIRWETTTITDIGFDAAFWRNRINVTFDWFNKITSDILLQLSMPTTFLGTLGAPYQNAGKVRNRGWELAANYNDHKNDWSWQAGFSLSGVKNEIIDNKGIDTYNGQTINREGNPIGSYYGLKAIGIYRTESDLNYTNSNGKVVTINGLAPSLGDIMYEDFNNDGNIDANDRQIIGNPFPDLTYSINLGVSWKNFDLTAFWQGVSGIYRYNWEQTTISNGGNMTSRWLDRWSADNVDGSMPRLGNEYNATYSSFWLDKADYLRLKNLELGYTFNEGILRRFGIGNLRIYLQATNLLTITSLDNYDPEKSSGDTRGDVHPNTQSFSFGINVKF